MDRDWVFFPALSRVSDKSRPTMFPRWREPSMMLLQNNPPGLLWLSLHRLPWVICQGLHLLRDPPGALDTLESPRDPLQPGLVGPAVGASHVRDGTVGRQRESASAGPRGRMVMRRGCRGHPDSKVPGDYGEIAASEAEWSIEQRLGVRSGLSPAPLLTSHVTLKAT